PLNPMVPAEDHEMVLPCASVMVIVVLLNDEFTCATPEAMFLRSRRRTRVASLPITNLSYDLKRRRNASGYTCGIKPTTSRGERIESARRSLFTKLLLLAGDGFGRPLARARIGMGPLTTHRQSTPMAQAPVTAEIHQPFDIDAGLA